MKSFAWLEKILGVNHADDVIDVVTAEGVSRMLRLPNRLEVLRK